MKKLQDYSIEEIPPTNLKWQARIAESAGWTEIKPPIVPGWNLYGVPPAGHPMREVVDKSGIKCKVESIDKLIEKLQAGPEMDALVAEAMGYEVLGITHCFPDPECYGYDVPYELEDWQISGTSLRPVYLRNCVCEFAQPEDRKIFGHIAGCLEVIKEYSREDMFAFEIVDWLVEQGYPVSVSTYSQNTYCTISELKEKGDFADYYLYIGSGSGETRPLAVCRALLSLYKSKQF